MSQVTVNVRRVKGDLREVDAMMKAVTQSHVALQFVRGGSLTSEESTQWIRTIEDRHNVAKHQAKNKLEEMNALVLVEGPPSKTSSRGARGHCKTPSPRKSPT